MVKALFDTNILIDYLRGIPAAREELGGQSGCGTAQGAS
jgi:hypothetical protein